MGISDTLVRYSLCESRLPLEDVESLLIILDKEATCKERLVKDSDRVLLTH